MNIIFWVCFAGIFHAYFGYPISLFILGSFSRKTLHRQYDPVSVTLIITAYNEEKRIREKLANSLSLEYPTEKLQIIVASDGSNDETNSIVKCYEDQGIELLEVNPRGGKENAQKEAVKCAHGEILVFSDVATIIEPKGLIEIVSNFSDQSVGCVSSEDLLIGQDGQPTGEGFYVRYEMWLRRLESAVNSVVGLSGSFFAAKKEVCQDFSADLQSDFRTLLNSINLGMRGVSDPKVTGSYLNISDENKEFSRKVRTVVRGITVFSKSIKYMNIFKYGFFSYQFFCHKLLRWLVPFFLILLLITNIALAFESSIFSTLLIAEISFYTLAIYGWFFSPLHGFFKIPTFFLIVNSAILIAWWQFFCGKRVVLWTPSAR